MIYNRDTPFWLETLEIQWRNMLVLLGLCLVIKLSMTSGSFRQTWKGKESPALGFHLCIKPCCKEQVHTVSVITDIVETLIILDFCSWLSGCCMSRTPRWHGTQQTQTSRHASRKQCWCGYQWHFFCCCLLTSCTAWASSRTDPSSGTGSTLPKWFLTISCLLFGFDWSSFSFFQKQTDAWKCVCVHVCV